MNQLLLLACLHENFNAYSIKDQSCYMDFNFESQLIFGHGPAPSVFAPVPEAESLIIKGMSRELSYGWGCIPAKLKVGFAEWNTSLFPKGGRYLIPIKATIQKIADINVGEKIRIRLDVFA